MGNAQFDQHSEDQMLKTENKKMVDSPKAFDAISIPMGIFFTVFFSVVYYLLIRWHEKIRNSTPLHVVNMSEMVAIITYFASCIYLLGFFGMNFVQATPFTETEEEDEVEGETTPCGASIIRESDIVSVKEVMKKEVETVIVATDTVVTEEDEEVIQAVVWNRTPYRR